MLSINRRLLFAVLAFMVLFVLNYGLLTPYWGIRLLIHIGMFISLLVAASALAPVAYGAKKNRPLTWLVVMLYIGLLPSGWSIFEDLFGSKPYFVSELPAPDGRHSIYITERQWSSLLDTFVYRHYSLAEPGFLFRKVSEFHNRGWLSVSIMDIG